MIVSAVLAFFYPFQLFIFAYAVFGPAHYFTQISWLHDRKYFSTARTDPIVLAVFALIATLSAYYSGFSLVGLSFIALGASLGFAFAKNNFIKVTLLVGFFLLNEFLRKTYPDQVLLLSIFIPTIIHVYVFTGLFILIGTLRQKSLSGGISLFLFTFLGIGFLATNTSRVPALAAWHLDYTADFVGLIEGLVSSLGLQYRIENIMRVMRFIAFAYTYHYLNWFSKTKVIEWHQIPRRRLVGIIVLYAVSLGLYAYNFAWGLTALFFFSYLHVLLEFPLDLLVIKEVFSRGIGAISSSRAR